MKLTRSQALLALISLYLTTQLHAQSFDAQNNELQELQNLSLEAQVFVKKPNEFGAQNITEDEDAWMKQEIASASASIEGDSISTGMAAPVRESAKKADDISNDVKPGATDIQLLFPLAPERKESIRKRSR